MKGVKIKVIEEIKKKIVCARPPESRMFVHNPSVNSSDEMRRFLRSKYEDVIFEKKNCPLDKGEVEVDSEIRTELDFFIDHQAFDMMYDHCVEMALEGLEALGFLIGELYQFEGKVFSVVHEVVTSKLESTPVSVRFDKESYASLGNRLDDISYDYIIVGWYHSHPGILSFMSDVDMNTQKRMFTKSFHTAVVIDPINAEMKSFRIKNMHCIEIPYAIIN